MGKTVEQGQSWTFGVVRDEAELALIRSIGEMLQCWPEYVNQMTLTMDASLKVDRFAGVQIEPDLMPVGRRPKGTTDGL